MKKKGRVLVVDSEESALRLLDTKLECNGFRVTTAQNGGRALSEAGRTHFDAVVLDMHMPGMSGFDVCRRLREDGNRADIPVVLLARDDTAGAELAALDLGADYMRKSCGYIPVLVRRLDAHMEAARRIQELQGEILLLRRQSITDVLTGTLARAYYDSMPNVDMFGKGVSLIDIDRFKAVNDTFGHGAGDECLKMVALALGRAVDLVPGCDLIRMGGEEFLLYGTPSGPQDWFDAAETVRHRVESLVRTPDGKPVTISVGAVYVDRAGTLKRAVVECADALMYHSKRNGRNRVTCGPYSEFSRHTGRREWVPKPEWALAGGGFAECRRSHRDH